MTWRPANNRMLFKMMSSVTWLSPKRCREEGTEGRWISKNKFCLCRTTKIMLAFSNVLKERVANVESENQGCNKVLLVVLFVQLTL